MSNDGLKEWRLVDILMTEMTGMRGRSIQALVEPKLVTCPGPNSADGRRTLADVILRSETRKILCCSRQFKEYDIRWTDGLTCLEAEHGHIWIFSTDPLIIGVSEWGAVPPAITNDTAGMGSLADLTSMTYKWGREKGCFARDTRPNRLVMATAADTDVKLSHLAMWQSTKGDQRWRWSNLKEKVSVGSVLNRPLQELATELAAGEGEAPK